MSHYQRTTSPLALLVSLALAGLLAIAGAGFAAPALAATSGATASSTSASAPSSFENTLFGWINRDRVARGLRPLRMDGRLNDLAGSRAANLAAANVLSHQVAGGNIGTTLSAWGMQWYRWGEAIGMTSYPYTTTAAGYLYGMWKHSAEHWALLMSTSFNYVGVGVAYRSSNRTTWASIVLTESLDHTRPGARMTGSGRSGTTIWFGWRGWDPLLQTHTAGLRNFDVLYRVDSGTWRLIRSGTTGRSISLAGRAHGHSYAVRVRSRDNRGNLSYWSSSLRVWVP